MSCLSCYFSYYVLQCWQWVSVLWHGVVWLRLFRKNMWPFSSKEASGFSSSSTAEQVTHGIDATGLTAIVTGPLPITLSFFFPVTFDFFMLCSILLIFFFLNNSQMGVSPSKKQKKKICFLKKNRVNKLRKKMFHFFVHVASFMARQKSSVHHAVIFFFLPLNTWSSCWWIFMHVFFVEYTFWHWYIYRM